MICPAESCLLMGYNHLSPQQALTRLLVCLHSYKCAQPKGMLKIFFLQLFCDTQWNSLNFTLHKHSVSAAATDFFAMYSTGNIHLMHELNSASWDA